MFATDMVFSVLFAAVIAGGFALLVRREGPRTWLLWFFVFIFLGTWAGGIWGRDVLPSGRSNAWIPFVGAGIVAALVASALQPWYPRVKRGQVFSRNQTMNMLERIGQRKRSSRASVVVLNALFWIVLVAMFLAIGARYMKDALPTAAP